MGFPVHSKNIPFCQQDALTCTPPKCLLLPHCAFSNTRPMLCSFRSRGLAGSASCLLARVLWENGGRLNRDFNNASNDFWTAELYS